jgi:hypothetical protein
MVIGPAPVCLDCRHLRLKKGNIHCEAFPDEIPAEIWIGGASHDEPFPGDHGIRFEPKDDVEP